MLAGEHSHDTGLGPSLGPPLCSLPGCLPAGFAHPSSCTKLPSPLQSSRCVAAGRCRRCQARAAQMESPAGSEHVLRASLPIPGRLPAPDSSQPQPAARQSLSRVSTGGASRLSSSPRLHRGSSALTSLPRVLLRHSLNPTARNAVHVLCISCFFPPSFRGWKQQQQKAPSVSPAGRAVCSSRGCHGQLRDSHFQNCLCLWGDLQWGWLLSTPSSQLSSL